MNEEHDIFGDGVNVAASEMTVTLTSGG